MKEHTFKFFARFLAISLVLVGGFFYTPDARAQTFPELPDLTVTNATLDGAALRYLYHNRGEGAVQPEVSFWYEWVDGQGRRLGKLYWINVGGMGAKTTREGNQLHDFSTLDFEHGQIKLADLIYFPPPGATHLKLAIDGPNVHAEANEKNNVVLLPVLRADFTITDTELRNGLPWFKYHNRGNLGHSAGKTISFWFEWVDARGARIGELYWLDVDPPLILSARSASLARSTSFDSTTTVFSAKGATNLTAFLNSVPSGATHLKLAIDGPNAYAEFDEGNNVALIDRAQLPATKVDIQKLPDLALTGGSRAGGVVRVTIVNSTPDTLRLPFLQFKWLDAKGAVLQTSPVSYWQHETIAARKTGDFTIEYEKWREDGVTRFLKRPPAGAVALLITIDPENKLKESDENNNSFRIDLAAAELEYGTIEVRNSKLYVEVKNSGKADAPATDIWMQWYGKGKWLDAGGVLEVPAVAAGTTTIIEVPLNREFRDGGAHLLNPPQDGERLRLFLDGSRNVEELNEQNNTAFVERAMLPENAAPKLTLTLALEVIREHAAAGAVSSFAGGGLTLALAALLAFGFMIHGHHGSRNGAAGFFSIFPLLFTASNLSYMYLRRCGPQGCSGKHFARYRRLKNATRASLGAAAGFGVLKIVVAALAVSVIGPVSDIAAQSLEVYAGDSVRASMVVKNSGTGPATALTARLACPSGSRQTGVELNGKTVSADTSAGIAIPDLGPDKAHSLKVSCKVTQIAAGSLRFQGEVKYKEGGDKPVLSNVVEIAVRPKPEPVGSPDLTVAGVGFLPKSDVTGDSKLFSAAFTAIVKNIGESKAGATSNRLRVDVGSNGTWDFTAPTLIETGALGTGEHETASWTIQWTAPLGSYTFEICADAGSEVTESSEENNCVQDQFTLQESVGATQEEEY